MLSSTDNFNASSYTYPFNFRIPTGIPGTYMFAKGNQRRMECSSTYTLYVELVRNDTGELLGRAMCPIVIMQRPRLLSDGYLRANINEQITTM